MLDALTPKARTLLALPLALALIAGCGGDSDSTSVTTAPPSADSFPSADGKTLAQLTGEAPESDLVVMPTQQVFNEGRNRYGFGVFTLDHGNVPDAEVAIYAAKPNGKATGPYPATVHSLETPPAFAAKTTTEDPDAAKYVYTTEVDLPSKGEWQILAMIRDDDGSYAYSRVPSAVVGKFPEVPQPGDEAPVTHTPTADEVGGDLTKIDTRQPPSSMHDVDYADVLGKEPIVLLFATPALCSSRVCGPVVDIAEEVKSERPDDAAFIHMEIYNDNDPNKGPRPQVQDFGLPSEPWLYVIDADGKVSTAIEGAFSKQELEDAIDKAAADSGAAPS
ncbi:MAG TPA: hypothetical protein VFH44_07125 [Solirubrobacterales bacterium]|nr:hypothetical protein [Solirubrobacterales bacterium]